MPNLETLPSVPRDTLTRIEKQNDQKTSFPFFIYYLIFGARVAIFLCKKLPRLNSHAYVCSRKADLPDTTHFHTSR